MLIKLNVLLLPLVLFLVPFQTEKKFNCYNPSWSPDGHRILFESTHEGKSSIYLIYPDGTRLQKITDSLLDYGQPAWSPDGKQVVYYGGVHPMQLYVNAVSGKEQKQISTPHADAYEPSWSVSNRIAFDSRDSGQTPNNISLVDIDGKHLTKLTDGKYDYASPHWSPDGKKIVLERTVAVWKKWRDINPDERRQMKDSSEIMLMNADGSGITNLTHDSIEERNPTWSADGKTVFYITRNDSLTVIHSLNLLTKKTIPVCSVEGFILGYSISPDNKSIVYSALRNRHSSIYWYEISKAIEKKVFGANN